MKISVVVPIYNVSRYLDKCISSICGQSYTNLEIILVDDGSTDNCHKICDRYASQDNRIKVIHKNNGGLVSARKAGVKAATGEYLLFVDGDDWIESDHIKMMIGSLHGKEPDFGTALTVKREYSDGSISIIEPLSDCRLEEKIYYKDEFDKSIWPEFISDKDIEIFNIPINAWIKLYKTEFIRKNIQKVDNDVTMIEDGLMNFICLTNANSMGIIKSSGYHYMIHEGSMVHHQDYLENVRAIKVVLNNVHNYIDNLDANPIRKNYYNKKWIRIVYYALMVSAPEYFSKLSEDFLFPYPDIKDGSRVLVYGLGGYGTGLVRYILSSDRFMLEGVSDRQIKVSDKVIMNGTLINEYRPEDLINIEYDYIVITTSRRTITDSIEKNIITMGVKPEKIAHMDQNLLNKDFFISAEWCNSIF